MKKYITIPLLVVVLLVSIVLMTVGLILYQLAKLIHDLFEFLFDYSHAFCSLIIEKLEFNISKK